MGSTSSRPEDSPGESAEATADADAASPAPHSTLLEAAPLAPVEPSTFKVGDLVRLVGLKRSDHNHHVGRVVSAGSSDRLGVALHKVIWPDAPTRGSTPKPLALKPENLRFLRMPGAVVPVLGSLPSYAVTRLLGESGWGLPENVALQVAELLQIEKVKSQEVSVVGCSSTRGDFPLSVVLDLNKADTWWISDSGTMTMGQGSEYLEFSLGGHRRLSFLGLRIPPLPQGPLSVRDFHLLAKASEEDWVPASLNPLQTLDRSDLQEFVLVPPVETTAIRLVCTSNAVAETRAALRADCIGLFHVALA